MHFAFPSARTWKEAERVLRLATRKFARIWWIPAKQTWLIDCRKGIIGVKYVSPMVIRISEPTTEMRSTCEKLYRKLRGYRLST